MPSHRSIWSRLALASGGVLCLTLAGSSLVLGQQDDTSHRGRKYKPLPATSHIEVVVTKKFNGKPIPNAAVVFDSKLNDQDEGNLEVKTDPEGKAIIDVVPTGSTLRVQVIATGFATFAQEYTVDGPTKKIDVALIHPQAQISSYVDNEGKSSQLKPGVQDPVRPKPQTQPQTPNSNSQSRSTPPANTQNAIVPDINPQQ